MIDRLPLPLAVSGGTSLVSTGTVSFANSNGVSFGLSDGTMTASVPSTAGLLSAVNVSAGTLSSNVSALVFSNSNGLSFGLDGRTITAIHNALTSQSNQAVSAGNGSFAFQTLSFSNANGVSFGTSAGSAITASHNGLTSQSNQAVSAANGSSTFQTLSLANSNGVSFSTGTQGVFATVRTDYLSTQSNQAVSAGNGSFAFQTLSLADSNGVSFSTGTQGVYATVKTDYLTSQSNQAFSAQGGSSAFQTLNFRNANGMSFSNSAGSVEGSYTVPPSFSAGLSNIGNTTGTSGMSGSRLVFWGNNGITLSQSNDVNGLSVGISGYRYVDGAADDFSPSGNEFAFKDAEGVSIRTTVDGATKLALVHNQAFSAGGGSSRFETLNFRNANGMSFSNSAGSVEASYTVPAQGSFGNSNLGNTAGDTGVVTGRLVLVGTNNITLSGSTNGGSMTISISGGAGAAGNTGFISAGASTASLGTVIFSNSNGVSFGVDGQTVTASHNGLTSQSNQNVTAANGGFAFQTLSFSNLNGISFGTSAGSAITASHNGLTSQSNQAFSAAGGSSAFQTLSFNNANGATFSNNGGAVEVSYTVPSVAGLLSNIRVSAGTTSNLLSALTFADSNGITFGLDASTVTASHNGLTSQSNQAASAANGVFTFQTLSFSNLNGISFGTSAGSAITASHNALTSQSNQAVSAGNGSSTFQTLSLADSNGVSFSTGTQGVFATVRTDYLSTQSNQNVTAANGGFAFQTLSFSNANNFSFGTSAGSAITGSFSQSAQTANVYAVGNTTGQSSSSSYDARTLSVDGAGIVSVGWSNSTLRISATQSNQAFSAQGGSSAFQTLSFNNANGATFANAGGAVAVSYTVPVVSNAIALVGSATNSGTNTSRFAADDHVHAGVFSVGVSNVGNTAGDTRVDVGRFVLAGGNNITLSQATAANALNTISVVGPSLSQSMGASNLGNTSGTSGIASGSQVRFVVVASDGMIGSQSVNGASATLSLINSWSTATTVSSVASANAVGANAGRFALEGHQHAGVGAFAAGSNTGNTAGNTASQHGTWVIAASTNITVSGSTGAGGVHTAWLSCAAGGGGAFSAGLSNIGNTSGDTGVTGTRLILAGGNNITLSQATNANGATITVSAPNLGAGAFSGGLSNVGNTAGDTGVTGTRLVHVGTGALLYSQATDANGGTITGQVGPMSAYAVGNTTQSSSGTWDARSLSFQGTGGVSVGVSNGSVVISGATGGGGGTLSGYAPYQDIPFVIGQMGQGTLQLEPEEFRAFQFDRLVFQLHNTNSSNSSGSHTLSFWFGLYTRNASTLSLWGSTSSSTALTHSGTVGSYSLYSGIRHFTIPWTTTVPEGVYWLGLLSRTTSGGANGTYSNLLISNLNSNFVGFFGSAQNTSMQLTLGQGIYTATTSGMPSSIAFSHIRGSDSAGLRGPNIYFASGTV
jgi:hypothetical protein